MRIEAMNYWLGTALLMAGVALETGKADSGLLVVGPSLMVWSGLFILTRSRRSDD